MIRKYIVTDRLPTIDGFYLLKGIINRGSSLSEETVLRELRDGNLYTETGLNCGHVSHLFDYYQWWVHVVPIEELYRAIDALEAMYNPPREG